MFSFLHVMHNANLQVNSQVLSHGQQVASLRHLSGTPILTSWHSRHEQQRNSWQNEQDGERNNATAVVRQRPAHTVCRKLRRCWDQEVYVDIATEVWHIHGDAVVNERNDKPERKGGKPFGWFKTDPDPPNLKWDKHITASLRVLLLQRTIKTTMNTPSKEQVETDQAQPGRSEQVQGAGWLFGFFLEKQKRKTTGCCISQVKE